MLRKVHSHGRKVDLRKAILPLMSQATVLIVSMFVVSCFPRSIPVSNPVYFPDLLLFADKNRLNALNRACVVNNEAST